MPKYRVETRFESLLRNMGEKGRLEFEKADLSWVFDVDHSEP